MQTMNATGIRPLSDTELDAVSGGYVWWAVGVGAAVVGAAAVGVVVGAKLIKKWKNYRNNHGGHGNHGGHHGYSH
ncbi:MAG: class IIb bacteriocin, lactobin A/cerein 7B family [Pseudomonadota bacterium]